MKKLMIAAAIVCAATFANAGAYVWGFGSGEDAGSNGGYLENATAFLYLGTITEKASGSSFILDFTAAQLVSDPATFNDPGAEDYTIGGINFDKTRTAEWVDTTKSQAYSLLLLEADGVADATKYEGKYALVTGESLLKQYLDGKDPIDYSEFIKAGAISQGNWKDAVTASDVPEPTSGLLMLLGMGALALRRRRA